MPSHGHHHDGDAPIHWARLYDLQQRLWGPRGRRLRTAVADRLGLRPADRVLDVASGTGLLAVELARRVGPDGSVDGIDVAPEMVEQATRKAEATGLPMAFRTGRAQQLPYDDNTFAALTCTLALHHIAHDERGQAAAEFYRVLRPGGRVLIADFQEPPGRVARFLTGKVFGHALAERPLDQATGLVAGAGFDSVTREDTPASWIGVVTAVKPS